MTKYTRANAEAILSVVTAQESCHWLPIPKKPKKKSSSPIYINDKGIFPNVPAEHDLGWKPCHELPDGPDSEDRAALPGLPFPFTAPQLAAFMLNGVGALVALAFGNLVEREPVEGEEAGRPTVLGPDFSVLSNPDANKAREAVQAAFDAYREAVAHVGAEPEVLSRVNVDRDEFLATGLKRQGLKGEDGSLTRGHGIREVVGKIRQIRTDYQTAMMRWAFHDHGEAHSQWLARMVHQLLVPDVDPTSSHVQQEGVSESQGESGQNEQKIDWALLATPDQLLAAFGGFGITKEHFKSVKGPMLDARKVIGKPGKKGAPPLFCPYEVVKWLVRRRKMGEANGHRLLRQHFPKAAEKFLFGLPEK